jgi:hypothetical protein
VSGTVKKVSESLSTAGKKGVSRCVKRGERCVKVYYNERIISHCLHVYLYHHYYGREQVRPNQKLNSIFSSSTVFQKTKTNQPRKVINSQSSNNGSAVIIDFVVSNFYNLDGSDIVVRVDGVGDDCRSPPNSSGRVGNGVVVFTFMFALFF